MISSLFILRTQFIERITTVLVSLLIVPAQMAALPVVPVTEDSKCARAVVEHEVNVGGRDDTSTSSTIYHFPPRKSTPVEYYQQALFIAGTASAGVALLSASLLSPSYVFDTKTKSSTFSVGLGVGIPLNKDSSRYKFSNARLQLEYQFETEELPTRLLATALWDVDFLGVIRPKYFKVGASIGIGYSFTPSKRDESGVLIWSELHIRHAMNLPFIFFYPQHSLGLRHLGVFESNGYYRNAFGLCYTATITF